LERSSRDFRDWSAEQAARAGADVEQLVLVFVESADQHGHRMRFGNASKALLAFPQRLLHPFEMSDVGAHEYVAALGSRVSAD